MEDNQNIDTAVDAQKVTAQPNEQKTEVVETPKAEQKPQEKTFTLTEAQLLDRVNRLAREKVEKSTATSVEENNSLKAEVDSLKNELTNYKKQLAFSKYKFNSEEMKSFVDFTVSQKVGNGVEFQTALDEYMGGEGAVFLAQETKPTPPPRPENMNTQDKDMDYLKKKYPNSF